MERIIRYFKNVQQIILLPRVHPYSVEVVVVVVVGEDAGQYDRRMTGLFQIVDHTVKFVLMAPICGCARPAVSRSYDVHSWLSRPGRDLSPAWPRASCLCQTATRGSVRPRASPVEAIRKKDEQVETVQKKVAKMSPNCQVFEKSSLC